jgi:hypothetical protein
MDPDMSSAKQTFTAPTQVVGLWDTEGRALVLGCVVGDTVGLAEVGTGCALGDSVGLTEGVRVGTIVDGAEDGTDELHAILGTKSSINEDSSSKSVTSATCPSLLSPAM